MLRDCRVIPSVERDLTESYAKSLRGISRVARDDRDAGFRVLGSFINHGCHRFTHCKLACVGFAECLFFEHELRIARNEVAGLS